MKSINNYYNLSQEEQLKLVQSNPFAIQFIPNPSQEVQLEAVKEDGWTIGYIPNPSFEVQLAAVKETGWAIQYISNPSLELQLMAITGKRATHIINNIKYFIPNQHPELGKEYAKWIINEINK